MRRVHHIGQSEAGADGSVIHEAVAQVSCLSDCPAYIGLLTVVTL